MRRRTWQWATLVAVFVLAALMFVFIVLAELANSNVSVWGSAFFISQSIWTWRFIGIGLFLLFVGLELFLLLYAGSWLKLVEITPEILGPQLHVRCRTCSVVHWVTDTGDRPLFHFCPKCGQEGQYGGEAEHNKDFIYTRIEVKLGCKNCDTSFLVPDPMVRPLYAECPSCHAKGVLKENQRPKEAEEVHLACGSCGHTYDIYTIKGRWSGHFLCPHCKMDNEVPQPDAAPQTSG